MSVTFEVEKMRCGGCARAVVRAVHSVEPAAQVTVDREAGRIAVEPANDPRAVAQAVTRAGYPARARA